MEKKNTFREIVWPILSLTIICLVVSLALGGVNMLTEKKIQDNLDAVANAGRREVLPGAADFEKIELTPEMEALGVTEVYSAGDAGFVISASQKGYAGQVPVMVGIGADGAITRIKVMDNEETPGLGKRVEEESFWGKFSGKQGSVADVATLAGATFSSTAVRDSVQNALSVYEMVKGGAN